jgi:hypothetical protein
MKSVPISSKCPSELSTPVYVHVVPYEPHLSVAENGVISKFCKDKPYVTVKVFCDYDTVFTMNFGLVCLHHELIEIIAAYLISTIVYAFMSLLNVTGGLVGSKINDDNSIYVIVPAGLVIIIGVDGAVGAIV